MNGYDETNLNPKPNYVAIAAALIFGMIAGALGMAQRDAGTHAKDVARIEKTERAQTKAIRRLFRFRLELAKHSIPLPPMEAAGDDPGRDDHYRVE